METWNGNFKLELENELRTGTRSRNSVQELGMGTWNRNSKREHRTGSLNRNLETGAWNRNLEWKLRRESPNGSSEKELGTGTRNRNRLWPHCVAQVLKDSAFAVVHNAFFSSLQKKSNRRSCLNW